MARTKTKQKLRVTVNVIDKIYQTGREAAESFKANMPNVFDEFLPRWNYTAVLQIEHVQVI